MAHFYLLYIINHYFEENFKVFFVVLLLFPVPEGASLIDLSCFICEVSSYNV